MLPLVYINRGAAALLIVACLIWLLPETVGMGRHLARVASKAASAQDRGSLGILIGLQWLGIALNFALAALVPAAALPWPLAFFLAGIVCMLLGVALRWYAIWTLGRSFSRSVAVSPDQPVVQRGPYRAIRHPAYSGTFLTMLGLGLALTNWASLAALLFCVVLGHLYRVSVEEKALISTIGQPYVEYMQRTRRFIPLVF